MSHSIFLYHSVSHSPSPQTVSSSHSLNIHKECHILSSFTTQCHTLHLYRQCLPHIHSIYTKNVTFYLPLPLSVTLSMSTVSVFLIFTPNISIFTAIPQHNISSLQSTALDIQHFIKSFTVTSGKMHCHAVMIHIYC